MAVGTWYDTADKSLFSPQEGARMGAQIGGQIANTRNSFARDAQAQDVASRTQAAIQDLAAYAESPQGHADDEQTFAVNMLKVLSMHGAQPGPIFQKLMEAKKIDGATRQKDAEKRQAREQAAQLAGAMVPELNPNSYNAPTQQTPEGNDFTPLADSEQAAQAFGEDTQQQDNRRAYMTGLASIAPDKFAGALVDQALKPTKDETPNWDSERGVYVYPSGRTVRPQGIEPKAKSVNLEQEAEQRGYQAAVARARGEVLTPEQTVDADTYLHKHQPKDRGAQPAQFITDSAGNRFALQPDGSYRKSNPEGWETKPDRQESQSPLSKMIADRNALPAGSPDRKYFDAAIAKATSSRGLRVKTNPDGTVEVSEGDMGGGGPGLAKPTTAKVESNILETGDTLRRLNGLEKDFNASFQRIGPRLSAWSAGWKDKGGLRLSPEDKINIELVTKQRKRAFDILNAELNRLSGAAVSDQELARLTKGLPNPGTGVFDGDSPVEFETKMKESISSLRAAMARYAYIRRHGLSLKDVDLSDMPALMNQRGDELLQGYKAKGIPDAEAHKKARQVLSEEFGLIQ